MILALLKGGYGVCTENGDASDIENVTGFAFPSLNIPRKALTWRCSTASCNKTNDAIDRAGDLPKLATHWIRFPGDAVPMDADAALEDPVRAEQSRLEEPQ
ncbi:hypothetical protein EAI_17302 [Harpegnathos saltator]|uniref:Uncharacterized protein n=1 Tax=Harpegnathos saltator TaxID=610380 RepID=E2BH43_HARSA|nr:hypothetical protein EAI_17302 [Harpegnathos saltator]